MDATEVEPLVHWDPKAGLVGPDGSVSGTEAQEAKVREYLEKGLIVEQGTRTETVGATLRSRTTTTYELAPVRGCKRANRVEVQVTYDLWGGVAATTYKCGCQRAAGTVVQRASICSHCMAIHAYREVRRAQG